MKSRAGSKQWNRDRSRVYQQRIVSNLESAKEERIILPTIEVSSLMHVRASKASIQLPVVNSKLPLFPYAVLRPNFLNSSYLS